MLTFGPAAWFAASAFLALYVGAFTAGLVIDPQEAPVNYSIFGPKFTFTGRMMEGEITVTDPQRP